MENDQCRQELTKRMVVQLLAGCECRYRSIVAELRRYLEDSKHDYMKPSLARLIEAVQGLQAEVVLPDA